MSVPTKGELRNRNVKCSGKSVIRDDHNMPILDGDGARQYKPCGNWAANGTRFCQKHGGSLQPTIVAAQRRLQYGSEDLVEILERIARDERESAADRIKAINSYLDRAGIRAGVDISLEVPVWQQRLRKAFGSQEPDDSDEPESEPERFPGENVIKERVRRLTTPPPAEPAPRKRAPRKATPPAEPTKPRKKATPPANPKFEGWE